MLLSLRRKRSLDSLTYGGSDLQGSSFKGTYKLVVAQTVLRVFVPCQKGGRFNKNGDNDPCVFYPLKTRASLLRSPKTTKMTRMAGVTQANIWFRKKRVCLSLTSCSLTKTRVSFPECSLLLRSFRLTLGKLGKARLRVFLNFLGFGGLHGKRRGNRGNGGLEG